MRSAIRTGTILFLLFLGVQATSSVSMAKDVSCSDIPALMQQMKQAQTSVQDGLISNHEMFAQSLESYSDSLSASAGRAHKAISENMKKATDSVRKRAEKAQVLSKKLETSTDELIKTVEKCLK